MSEDRPIAIAGAGAVGLYVAGVFAAAGRPVRALARPRVIEAVQAQGLTVTDLDGVHAVAPASALGLTDDPAAAFGDARMVLVAVKSRDTAAMGARVGAHAPAGAVIASLQNGVRNADRLREALPGRDVRAGVVAPNIAWRSPAHLHRATTGGIIVEDSGGALGHELSAPGMAWTSADPIAPIQWGKLLLNLNNALNALSAQPLRAQLGDPSWRAVLSACLAEARAALTAAGVRPGPVGKENASTLAFALRLPTPVFRFILDRRLKIDPSATSSMQDDLNAGRPTEIDDLQGEIVRLAGAHGVPAPVNAAVLEAVRACEAGAARPVDPARLLTEA